MKATLNILLLILFAAGSLWCTGGLMRKCDQAAILAGANDLAHGRVHDPFAYYQVDKTYVVYGVCAAVLKMCPVGIDPVAAANVGLALIFWSALTFFVVRFRRRLEPLVLLCFLAAPAVLLNTLYVNSSLLSSAFLLLSAAFIQDSRRRGWAAALFFFLAVGSRADVILLLPLLLWLITPLPTIGKIDKQFSKGRPRAERERLRHSGGGATTEGRGKNGVKSPADFSKVWKICFAGAFALAAGRIAFPCGGAAFDPIFNWKMVAGYTVFGFGAAGLLFVLYAIRLAGQAVRGEGALEKLYGLAGLAAFLLPVLFFIPQLHAPRYFWRGCEAVLLLAVSCRLPAWNSRWLKAAIYSAALVPLVLGVKLPELAKPRPTVASPELFPSGDGLYPMGAYCPFLLRMREADRVPMDHNQLVWSAVHSAQFKFSPDGTMDVLFTPMYGYFMLEASLRGGFAHCRPFEGLCGRPFYADSRSLMRTDPKSPLGSLSQILELPAHFVSPVADGIGVLRFGEGGYRWGQRTLLLNRLFSGNEYRVLDSETGANRKKVRFSEISFESSEQDPVSGLYYSVGAGRCIPGQGFCAEAVLPGWMSLQAFGSGQ